MRCNPTRARSRALFPLTAGSDEKLAKAQSLGAVAGFNYKKGQWAEPFKQATDGAGANIILDCVGGSYVEQNLEALAIDGRWVSYGLMGGYGIAEQTSKMFLAKLLRKRASLRATTLRSRPKSYKADLVSRFITHAKPHFESGNYKAVIDQKEFALESASDAHAYMASNLNIGKILLKVL